jgi:Plavaka transposase
MLFTKSINNTFLKHDGERIYGEQNTGLWWENTEKSLPIGAKLLSLILYSDATNVDSLGKSQLHPIYVSIGNIKNWRRNKPDAKQLLGYLPILKASNSSEKKSENFKIMVRKAFHESLEVLLDCFLSSNNGIDLEINNEKIWFFPRISVVIADWPEAATYCLTYKSAMSNFPCHFCLVARENLSSINLTSSEMELRTHNNMRQFFDQNSTNSVSIENLHNFFWKFP